MTNIYDIEPTKFPNINIKKGVCHDSSRGPYFGYDSNIGIYQDFLKEDSRANFSEYQDILGKGKSIFTGNLDNNKRDFKVKEIEVFKILK